MVTIDDVYNKLDGIQKKIDSIEPTLKTIEKLQESGVIGMLEGVAEEFDNLFNYASKSEIFDIMTLAIKTLEPLTRIMKKGDIEKLLSVLEKVEVQKLVPLLEAVANCAPKVDEVMKVTAGRKKKMSLMELMNTVRSPEMASLLTIAKELSGCMMENSKSDNR